MPEAVSASTPASTTVSGDSRALPRPWHAVTKANTESAAITCGSQRSGWTLHEMVEALVDA